MSKQEAFFTGEVEVDADGVGATVTVQTNGEFEVSETKPDPIETTDHVWMEAANLDANGLPLNDGSTVWVKVPRAVYEGMMDSALDQMDDDMDCGCPNCQGRPPTVH